MMESDIAIEARQLSKNFGRTKAVKSASFRVKKGEIFGFFGPNGAGKTTTINLLCGLVPPSSGSAHTEDVYQTHFTSLPFRGAFAIIYRESP